MRVRCDCTCIFSSIVEQHLLSFAILLLLWKSFVFCFSIYLVIVFSPTEDRFFYSIRGSSSYSVVGIMPGCPGFFFIFEGASLLLSLGSSWEGRKRRYEARSPRWKKSKLGPSRLSLIYKGSRTNRVTKFPKKRRKTFWKFNAFIR